MCAKKIVDLLVSGGKATAGPPLGPALGPLGVNVMAIVNKINELTNDYVGMKVPVKVSVDSETKEFEVSVGTPTMSALIVKELKIEKGSGTPNTEKVGDLTMEQVIHISELKSSELLAKTAKAAAKEVDQINQLEDQRKKNMSIYTIVIILCFFVFLAIILILNKTILSSFMDIQDTAQLSQIGNAITSIGRVDPLQLQYVLFSFVFVQSIGAGVLAGFMMDGKLSSGFRYSCVLGLASFFIFKLLF